MMKMKQYLTALAFFIFSLPVLNAQLPDGTIAPDWTLTDLNGNSHHLYEILDAGKTVVIDFSATWCGPCWNYHNTGRLETLWDDYGPDGTDEIMVFFLEGDLGTNDACLYGDYANCSGTTQGDWVSGTGYPICNIPASQGQVVSDYQIGYWPTLYVVCSDTKKVYEVGQASVSGWESYIFESCELSADYIAEDALCFETGSIDLTPEAGYGYLRFDWNEGSDTEDLENIGPGFYSVTITDGHNVSFEIDDIEISGTDLPFEVQLDDLVINDCFGENYGAISVSAVNGEPPFNYNWNNGASGATISDLQEGEYIVTITDLNGCEAMEIFMLEDPSELDLNVDPVNATCGLENGELHLEGIGGTGSDYLYDIGSGFYPDQDYYDLIPGEYIITVQDENGCMFETSQVIIAGQAPVADAGPDKSIDCVALEVELDGGNSSAGPDIDYYWSTIDGNIVSGGNTRYPIVDAAGNYTLAVFNYVDDCEEYDEVVVTALADLPEILVETPELLTCVVPSIVIDASGSDSGSDYINLWTTIDGSIVSGETTLTPTVDAPGTYTLNIYNVNNGCESTMDVIVESNVLTPSFDVNQPEITCDVPEVELCVTPIDNVDHVIWADATEGLCRTVSESGIYAFTAYAENGCTTDGEIEVTIDNDLPDFTVNNPELTCTAPEVEICVTPVANLDHVIWADGTEGFCKTETAAGIYTFTAYGVNGCTTEGEVEVTVDANVPVAAAGEDQLLTCTITTVTLDGSASSQGEDYTYEWTDADGNVLGTEVELVVEQNGTYILTVSNTVNGCISVDEVFVDENIDQPDPTFSQVLDYNILNLTSTAAGTDDVSSWTSSDGQSADGMDAVFTYLVSGVYEICHTVSNDCGSETICEMVTVEILPLTFDSDVTDLTCPEENDGKISVSPSGGVADYIISWSGPNGFTSDQFSMDNLEAGSYTMQLVDQAGTMIEETFVITQPDPIVVELEVGDEIDGNQNGSIDITVSGGTAPYTFSWSNGLEVEDLSDLASGEYTLVVTDANGCTTTVIVTVDSKTNSFEIEFIESFTVNPNPAFNNIVVYLQLEKQISGQLTLVNKLGQHIQSFDINALSNKISINTSDLEAGLYFIRLETANGAVTRKVVKL